MSLALESVLRLNVLLYSAAVIGIIYGVRFITMRTFAKKDVNLFLYVAPRGLVTVLLFFAIPEKYAAAEFESGILLLTIIVTSVLMTMALIKNEKDKDKTIDEMIDAESLGDEESPQLH